MTDNVPTKPEPPKMPTVAEQGQTFAGKGEDGPQRMDRLNKQVKIMSQTLGNLDGRLCALEKLLVQAIGYQQTLTAVVKTTAEVEKEIRDLRQELESLRAESRFDMGHGGVPLDPAVAPLG
jgi:cell division protein FtsB|tara:strand:+ start:2399 stop:2761 length:363 start_codon:yes stop_codon:yes gene_type:complete